VVIGLYPKLDAAIVMNTPIGHALHVNVSKTLLMFITIAKKWWNVLPPVECIQKFSIKNN